MTLPYLTVIGRLTRDPEVRITPAGKAVCSFSVAASNRAKDGDEWVDKDTSFFDVTCWDQLAENVADLVGKGREVLVHGQMRQRFWEDKDGNKRSSWDINATHVGLSLRWADAFNSGSKPASAGGKTDDAAPPF